MEADPVVALVRRALDEDAADRDITTQTTVPEHADGVANLIARAPCVIAGLDVFATVFVEQARTDRTVVEIAHDADGTSVQAGARIARVEGRLRTILAAERTALNFAQRLCGIATLTRTFVEAAGGVEVRDTRKTTPGLRVLEKAAVRAGGGVNHRATLADAILIKDNHIAAAGDIERAVKAAKQSGQWVEVECETLAHVRAALDAGADELLLDNMDLTSLREAARIAAGRAKTEASGGVTLANIAAIAACGVDSISVGALTHSAPAIDLSLEVEVR